VNTFKRKAKEQEQMQLSKQDQSKVYFYELRQSNIIALTYRDPKAAGIPEVGLSKLPEAEGGVGAGSGSGEGADRARHATDGQGHEGVRHFFQR
jgi:hypothetical protein